MIRLGFLLSPPGLVADATSLRVGLLPCPPVPGLLVVLLSRRAGLHPVLKVRGTEATRNIVKRSLSRNE